MAELPKSLDEAIEQAKTATRAAIEAGHSRLQVEFLFPELKPMPVAEKFLPLLQDMGLKFKVYFPDAGAAALARRDWGNPDFSIRGVSEFKGQIESDDEAFLIVAPSAVEVEQVEKMSLEAGDRPFILLNPRLEDIATIGIGYAGRQLRERFLSKIETCYSLRPLEGIIILRQYPELWQVWLETEPDNYQVIAEEAQRPAGEALDRILLQATGGNSDSDADSTAPAAARPKRGLFAELRQFLRALSQ
jgi:hypothetical protein